MLLGFGLGVLLATEGWGWDRPDAPSYVLGAGIGALAAAGLERQGFTADLGGVAGTLVAIGGLYALQADLELVDRAWLFCAGLAAVGAVNLLLSRR